MIAFSSNWLILFPIAFSLYVAMRLSQGSVDQGTTSLGVQVIRVLIVLLFTFSFLGIGIRANLISLIWLVLVVLFAAILLWKNKRLERSAMLLTFLQSEDQRQFELVAEHFADENVGWLRSKANRLRSDVQRGVFWSGALEWRGLASGVYQRLALRIKGKYGKDVETTDPTMSHSGIAPVEVEAQGERMLGRLLVFSWIILLVPLVVSFFVYITPTYRMIFDEFETAHHPTTEWIFWLESHISPFLAATASIFAPGVVLGVGAVMLGIWVFPSVMQLPVLRWFLHDYYENAGFTALATTVARETDLIAATRATAALVPVSYISARFQAASHHLEQGMAPVDAFRKAQLIRRKDSVMFAESLKAHNPSWGLQQLAGWRMERMLNRYSVFMQIFVFALTLLIAGVVAVLAMGSFAGLRQLILNIQ